MIEYSLSNKESKADTRVIFVDKGSKKLPANLKTFFSKEDINLCEKLLSDERNKKDIIVTYTENSEIILFLFDKDAKKASLQKYGAKLGKSIFNSQYVDVYLENIKNGLDNIVIGIETGIYRFNKYFTQNTDEKKSSLKYINFILLEGTAVNNFSKALTISSAVNYTRDFVNEPANVLTPDSFAKSLLKMKKTGLEVEILNEKDLEELGFSLLLSVAQGSEQKPRVVVFSWKGNPKKKDYDLALLGKGVTFDSGGLSLKPSNSMEGMHTDMAGAAAVSGTMKAISELNISKNILGMVGLVENMPSGNAYRVNDIIKSMSGQTVEVLNTDAEGRLVLADLLTYTQRKYKAKQIIDLATLTGAVSMLLGPVYAGLFSNDEAMISNLTAAGETSGDRLWKLPMDEYFNKAMDSTYADIQNIGKHRVGGGSQAACFLKRFVEEGTSWTHLDIAGVAREALDEDLYAKGATGFGVRLLVDYINSIN